MSKLIKVVGVGGYRRSGGRVMRYILAAVGRLLCRVGRHRWGAWEPSTLELFRCECARCGKVKIGRRPPLHFNCKCTIEPALTEILDSFYANEFTYESKRILHKCNADPVETCMYRSIDELKGMAVCRNRGALCYGYRCNPKEYVIISRALLRRLKQEANAARMEGE